VAVRSSVMVLLLVKQHDQGRERQDLKRCDDSSSGRGAGRGGDVGDLKHGSKAVLSSR
jgi:hypothetical protein